jgi:hypothetical protein
LNPSEFVQLAPLEAFDTEHEEHDTADQKNDDVDNFS